MSEGATEPPRAATATGARAGSGGRLAAADPLAAIVFAALVAACFAAFFITQRLKHSPTAVQSFKLTPRFSPTPAGHIKQERISFKLARADEVTVTIVNATGSTVATLVSDRPVVGYKQFSLRWNGREGVARGYSLRHSPDGATIVTPVNEGRLAPEGEYRVRVNLRAQHRELLSPRSFELVRG